MRLRKLSFLVAWWTYWLLCPCLCLQGQIYPFKNYTAADGLSDNFVFRVIQDHRGYLWFATSTGVSRYNGVTFKNYTIKDGLADNSVREILEDKEGRLWFATGGGLSCLKDGKFTNYTRQAGLPHDFIQTMVQDKEGNLWLGTRGGGLSRFDGHGFINYDEKEGMRGKTIWILTFDKEGHLWIGTRESGPYRFDGKAFHSYSTKDGLPDNQVFSLHLDRQGRLWLGTAKGPCFFDGVRFHPYAPSGLNLGSVADILQDSRGTMWFGLYGKGLGKLEGNVFTNFRAVNGLANDYVTSLSEDREGTLWVGTQGSGVSKFRSDRFASYTSNLGLCTGVIHAVAQDPTGHYWFGSFGDGLCRYDGNHFFGFHKKDGLVSDLVEDIAIDGLGRIYVATDGGLSILEGGVFKNYTVRNGLPNNVLKVLRFDRKGALWIGTFGGGACRYDGKEFRTYSTQDGLSNDRVYSICEDSFGRMWFGTDEGASVLDHGEFKSYSVRDGLPAGKVSAILESPNGILWFGTDSGLSRFDGKFFAHYAPSSGLADPVIHFLQLDLTGDLWIGTNKGVSRFDRVHEVFQNFGKRDGLAADETLSGAAILDHQGKLWFGTTAGVVCCKPVDGTINTMPPPVIIEGVKVFERDIDPEQLTRLTPTQNQLTFSYIALSYSDESRVKYQYLLEGFDSDWSPITDLRFCKYTNLPPQKYRFRVRGANSDGVWNHAGAALELEILPHLYQKRGFQWAMVLGLVVALYGLYRWRVWRIRRLNQALERRIRSRTLEVTEQKELLSKINLELQALHNTSTAISSTLDKEELGRLILETSTQLLQCTGGFLIDYVWSRQAVTVTQAIGWAQVLSGKEIPLKSAMSRETIETRESRVFSWEEVQRKMPHAELQSLLKPCQIVMVPMICSDRVVGVLVLGRDSPGPAFSARDLSLLTSFANQAAVSIRNAQLYQAVRASESKHRALIEQAGDAIFVIDADGNFDSVNSMAVRLLGYSENEYKTLTFYDLLEEPERLQFREKLDSLAVRGSLLESVEFQHKEGHHIPVEVNAVQLDSGFCQAIVRDITERKRLEEDLAEQRDRAEEASRLKSEFLASISHELRTPLHAILSYADFGLEKVSNAERERLRQYFAEIKGNGGMLLRMINDLLDLSKMEAGKMVYHRAPLTMRVVIEDACSRVAQLAETKEIQLRARAFPKDWMVFGDYEMLLRVLINLLGNAIKFTPPRGEVVLFAQHGIGEHLFGIRDTGQGIYPEELDLIFEKFAQSRLQNQERQSGSGLGLSICRSIIEAHQGRLWAESAGPGQGSTFMFALPVYPSQDIKAEKNV